MIISNQSDLLKERRGLSSKLEERAAQAVAWKAPAVHESAR